ncbi:MAG: hypothetical protein AABZ39_06735 [Spirochaetota bacterium]
MERKRTLWNAAVIILAASGLWAQSILNISPYPVGQAMSGAFSAYAKDSEAMFYNPAATCYGYKNDIYATYTAWLAETSLMAISYRYKVDSKLAFGVSLGAFFSGNIDYSPFGASSPFTLDAQGFWVLPQTAQYSYSEVLLTLNASYLITLGDIMMAIGANAKLGGMSFDMRSLADNEGAMFAALDTGILFPVHVNFAISDVWLKRIVPEYVAFTFTDLGINFDPSGRLTATGTDMAFRLGLGFNLFAAKFIFLDLPSRYNLKMEMDISSDDIYSMGAINDFNFNKVITSQLLLGFKANPSGFWFSSGLFVGFDILKVIYSVGYTFTLAGSLGYTHQFSFNADFDFDIVGSIFGKDAKTVQDDKVNQGVAEIVKIIRVGEYKQAIYILKQLLEKYPDDQRLQNMRDRLREINPEVDSFFY